MMETSKPLFNTLLLLLIALSGCSQFLSPAGVRALEVDFDAGNFPLLAVESGTNLSSLQQALDARLNGAPLPVILQESEAEPPPGEKLISMIWDPPPSAGDRPVLIFNGLLKIEPDRLIHCRTSVVFNCRDTGSGKISWKKRGPAQTIAPGEQLHLPLTAPPDLMRTLIDQPDLIRISLNPVHQFDYIITEAGEVALSPGTPWENGVFYQVHLEPATNESDPAFRTTKESTRFYVQSVERSEPLSIRWVLLDSQLGCLPEEASQPGLRVALRFDFTAPVLFPYSENRIQCYPMGAGEWQSDGGNPLYWLPDNLNHQTLPQWITILPGIIHAGSRLPSQKTINRPIEMPPIQTIPSVHTVSVINVSSVGNVPADSVIALHADQPPTLPITLERAERTLYTRQIEIRFTRKLNPQASSHLLQGIDLFPLLPEADPLAPVRQGFFFSPDGHSIILVYRFSRSLNHDCSAIYRLQVTVPSRVFENCPENVSIPGTTLYMKEKLI